MKIFKKFPNFNVIESHAHGLGHVYKIFMDCDKTVLLTSN